MQLKHLQQYMRLSGYSDRTIKAYSQCIGRISKFHNKPISNITMEEFKKYLDKLLKKGNSPYTINQYHAAYKLFTTKILKNRFDFKFPYVKRHKKLPVVLSRREISLLIKNINNSKHKLIVSLSYGAGFKS